MFFKNNEDYKPKLNIDSKLESINIKKQQKSNKLNQVTREKSLPEIKEEPEDFQLVNPNYDIFPEFNMIKMFSRHSDLVKENEYQIKKEHLNQHDY